MSDSKSAAPSLAVERIEGIDDLEGLRDDWNALLEGNETRTVELTHEWQTTYWKHFGGNSRLFVLVVREAGSIVAIAPLKLARIRKCGVRVRSLEFIAANESNYQDFIIGKRNEEVLESILNYLVSNREQWDILNLRHVPETSTTPQFFLGNLDNSLLCRIADVEECIFLKVDKPWEEFNKTSKKARRKIANRMRRLQGLGGEIDHFHCSDEEQTESNLLKFFELHRKRWNQTETPSQFNDKRCREFYLEVTPKLLSTGQVDLFVLRAGGVPVALLYSFFFGQTCLTQLIAYDTDYSPARPGLVAFELFVKQAFDKDVKTIDFGHYYPYKELWGDCLKSKMCLEIYCKRTLSCFIAYVLTTCVCFWRPRLKKITPLRQFVIHIRRRVRGATSREG